MTMSMASSPLSPLSPLQTLSASAIPEAGQQGDHRGAAQIRQIEAKALRKLRHPSRSDQLRSFLIDD